MLEVFKTLLLIVNLVLTISIILTVIQYTVIKQDKDLGSITYVTATLWGLFYYLS